ncbi:hypothetical protein [Halopseudomonas sp.]|uniref:hypothetical protein n=1 Tax=Halopseudomonas sp. TaxID=2901191 RepID=UPI0035305481
MKQRNSEDVPASEPGRARRFIDWRPTRLAAMLLAFGAAARAALTGSLRPALPTYPESAQFRGERFRNKQARTPISLRHWRAACRHRM